MPSVWNWLAARARGLAASVHRTAEEREMREEMRFHLDMAAAKYRAAGLADPERRARLSFGGEEQWREAARDELRPRVLEEVIRDIHYAVRSLRHVPAFTLTVILSLAIGIGAVSTVWTVTERVILRPLPYGGGGPLVFLWTNYREKPNETGVNSFLDYTDWATQDPDIARAAVFNIWAPTLTEGGDPESLVGSRVSAGFFDVLGVSPMLGRSFRPEEDVPNGPPVCVIAYSLWHRRFNDDPSIVGKQIGVNTIKYTVIGVMPPSFRDPEPFWKQGAEIWRPLNLTAALSPQRTARWLRVVARLKPGVTVERAQRNLTALSARIARENPQSNKDRGGLVVPIHEQVVGASRPVLLAALGGALCLLLIVCGNVGSLVLARHAARAPELAVRAALGGDRSRIARLLVLETLVLASVGCVLGLFIAGGACALVRHAAPPRLPRVEEIHVDLIAAGVTALIAVLSAGLFGVLPAWGASRVDLAVVLQGAGQRATVRARTRNAIVVGELAFSLVLLVAAGLLGKSMIKLGEVPLGVEPRGVVSFDVSLPSARYKSDTASRVFFNTLDERLRNAPGVDAVAMTSSPLFTGLNDMEVASGGTPERRIAQGLGIHFRSITPGYFALLHVPLTGRDFSVQDVADRPRVGVINRAAADAFFPGQNPIGRRLMTAVDDTNPVTIVGVVGNVLFYGPALPGGRELFVPMAQNPWSEYTVMLKGRGTPGALLGQARTVLHALDPNIPLADGRSMEVFASGFSASQRYYGAVFGAFAAAAVLLSAVGIFGVIAYATAQRRREIAIRMALGARAADIARRFVGNAALLVLLGVLLGAAGAVLVGRAIASLLFGVTPGDVVTLAIAASVLGVVGVAASVGPALRAVRASPLSALR